MSDKAFKQFVAEVRDACTRFLNATGEPLLEKIAPAPPLKPARPKKMKGNPVCRCGHNWSVHDEPRDSAKGVPQNICRGCEADGSVLGCAEFTKKGAPIGSEESLRPAETRSNGTHEVGLFQPVHRAILAALVAKAPLTAEKISIYIVYTQSGTFNTAIADLRETGLIEGSPLVRLTAAGQKAAVGADARVSYTPSALRAAWSDKLKKETARRMIDALARGGMSVDKLAETCRYTQSGTFNSMLAKLRRMGIVEEGQPVRLCPEMSS